MGCPVEPAFASDRVSGLLSKRAGRRDLTAKTTIEELGLSSLERVELMVALEDAFQTHHRRKERSRRLRDVAQLRTLVRQAATGDAPVVEPVDFPTWNRTLPARIVRRINLPTVDPAAGSCLRLACSVEGLENLQAIDGPVVFAANHQSHMDVPVIFAALPPHRRYRVAPAMAKEFFKAHFFPSECGRRAWFTNSLNYYLAALVFNAFPLPQREAGARQTLRYVGGPARSQATPC